MAKARLKDMEFDYEVEQLDINDIPPIEHDDAKNILFKSQDLLKAIGVDLYLSSGTLLGAIREKDFIKGDLDVDTYIKDEDTVFKNLRYLHENGLKLIRYKKNVIFSFRDACHPGCYIDMYVWGPVNNIWGIYCYHISNTYIPKKYIKDDDEIEFLGRVFKCPKNPIGLLKFWYGDTWNVPIGKFEKKYYYEVKSHYYYQLYKKKLIFGIQNLIGWYHWRHLVKKEYRDEKYTKG